MEAALFALLKTQCDRVFPDIAPEETALPYVTFQGIGGVSMRNMDNTTGNKRNTLMQISVWSASRIASLDMVRSIEDALCASTNFIAVPQGEPLSMYEEDPEIYGCLQRFSIWANR
jgi:hypothetical protein